MTKRHYFQSLVIFIATAYFVDRTLHLRWIDTFLLMLLLIVCVFHTMDVRDDIEMKRLAKKRAQLKGQGDEGPTS